MEPDHEMRIMDMNNWICFNIEGSNRWFYWLGEHRSTLVDTYQVIREYKHLLVNWHCVVYGVWNQSEPELRRQLCTRYWEWAKDSWEDECLENVLKPMPLDVQGMYEAEPYSLWNAADDERLRMELSDTLAGMDTLFEGEEQAEEFILGCLNQEHS